MGHLGSCPWHWAIKMSLNISVISAPGNSGFSYCNYHHHGNITWSTKDSTLQWKFSKTSPHLPRLYLQGLLPWEYHGILCQTVLDIFSKSWDVMVGFTKRADLGMQDVHWRESSGGKQHLLDGGRNGQERSWVAASVNPTGDSGAQMDLRILLTGAKMARLLCSFPINQKGHDWGLWGHSCRPWELKASVDTL